VGGVLSPRSAGSRRPGTMELDLAATCRRESGQLVVDSLLHRKPMQATKNWRDVVASACSRQKARRQMVGEGRRGFNHCSSG